jgi:hypothetical protein
MAKRVKIAKGKSEDVNRRIDNAMSILRFTSSDFPFVIFTCLAIVLSILRFTSSDYPFAIFTRLAIVLSILRLTIQWSNV